MQYYAYNFLLSLWEKKIMNIILYQLETLLGKQQENLSFAKHREISSEYC